jgi:hypothetical protein
MIYDSTQLYLEFSELTAAGVQEDTVKKAIYRETIKTLNRGGNGSKVLIDYASLPDKYKSLIKAKFGCPYKFMAAQIIKQHIVNKQADIDFITAHKLPDGANFPVAKQQLYITACSYLDFLSQLSAKKIRALGYKSTTDFYEAIMQLIKGETLPLPESYSKLRSKARAYKEHGASVIVSKKWCNKNSLKIKDEVCESVLLEMISHSSQFEDPFVARKYNQWAEKKGYKKITDATVGIWRRKNSLAVTASREGHTVWHNQFNPIVRRERPSAPLLLINSDDNNLDLFFREDGSNYVRVTLMVVMDAFNNYPLGYAIGRAQTTELVHEAYLNAIHHVRELTGEQVIWHQVCTDSWGLKQLRDWYSMQATFTPTRTGNARGKVIEQAFGNNWHGLLRQYMNYGGYNITAQHKRNPDAIRKNAKDFPHIDDAPAQVADFFNKLRSQVNEKTGKTKQQEWLEAFRALPEERKRSLSDTKRILLFGKRHTWQNKITNAGINISLNKHPLIYDIPKADYAKHVGRTMQVIYDPYDLTSILATSEDARIQILCPVMEKMKMAIADFAPGDRARLNVKLNAKRELSQNILDAQQRRQQVLAENNISAEGLLQAGVLVKEQRQLAENTLHSQDEAQDNLPELQQPEEEDYFDLKIRLEQNNEDASA